MIEYCLCKYIVEMKTIILRILDLILQCIKIDFEATFSIIVWCCLAALPPFWQLKI